MQIKIAANYPVYTIQVKYKTVDNIVLQKPIHGNIDNRLHHLQVINLEDGERINGAVGMVCNGGSNGTYVRQLAFMSQTEDGQKLVYGPFGDPSPSGYGERCQIFIVNGKINSIFGRTSVIYRGTITQPVLGAIGFYYEDESISTQHTT